jgi:hypothetical protein
MKTKEMFLQHLDQNEDELKRDYYRHPKSTGNLIKNAIQGNTFRAYKEGEAYLTNHPSSIFRTWAWGYLNDASSKDDLLNSPSFDAIHKAALKSLHKFWKENEGN